MRVQRIKQPNWIPSQLVQTHQRKQRSHHTLDVQDQWKVCVLSIIVQFLYFVYDTCRFHMLVAITQSLIHCLIHSTYLSHIFLIVASWQMLILRKRVFQRISSFFNWLFTFSEYDWKHLLYIYQVYSFNSKIKFSILECSVAWKYKTWKSVCLGLLYDNKSCAVGRNF